MGWSGGDMSESVDGVGSGTLAGSTCIGDSGRVLIYGCGGATGWAGIGCTAGAGAGACTAGGAVAGAMGVDEKNWGGS